MCECGQEDAEGHAAAVATSLYDAIAVRHVRGLNEAVRGGAQRTVVPCPFSAGEDALLVSRRDNEVLVTIPFDAPCAVASIVLGVRPLGYAVDGVVVGRPLTMRAMINVTAPSLSSIGSARAARKWRVAFAAGPDHADGTNDTERVGAVGVGGVPANVVTTSFTLPRKHQGTKVRELALHLTGSSVEGRPFALCYIGLHGKAGTVLPRLEGGVVYEVNPDVATFKRIEEALHGDRRK